MTEQELKDKTKLVELSSILDDFFKNNAPKTPPKKVPKSKK